MLGLLAFAVLYVLAPTVGCSGPRVQSEKAPECLACHKQLGDWKEHETTGHRDVECTLCHVPHDLPADTLKDTEFLLVDNSCDSCHQGRLDDTSAHGYHAQHIKCLTCHSAGIHKFKPSADLCQECHIEMVVVSPAMTENHCVSCHEFMTTPVTETPSRRPSRQACLKCHGAHRPDISDKAISAFFDDIKHSQMNCNTCHKPHESKELPDRDTCFACHLADSIREIPPHNWEFHLGDCAVCHQPHSFAPEAATVGGPEYLAMVKQEDAGSQEPKFRLNAEGKVDGGDCNSCHEFGEYARSVSAASHPSCASCHGESTFEYLGDRGVCGKCHTMETGVFNSRGHQSCQGCHSGHSWAGAGEGLCDRCHSDVREKLADITAKSSCFTCHGSHDARAPGMPEGCETCHGDVASEAPEGIAAKLNCGSCHETHAWEYRAGSCAVCHGDVYEATPDDLGFKVECLNCHTQHEWAASVDDCAMCHADAVEDTERIEEERYEELKEELEAEGRLDELPEEPEEFLKRDCTQCHQMHEWRVDAEEFDCTVCHGEMETGLHYVPGHRECLTCHGEHLWMPAEREICAACHTDREDHYPGTDCVSCHWDM